jgi:hypothetical protein
MSPRPFLWSITSALSEFLNTKSIILRPKRQGKALTNSQLRHSLKKVAFPMHYLRDFG